MLLKNDGPTLPLSEGGTVAVLGPNAADWRAMAGDYSPSWLGQDGGESYESVREALTRLSGSRHEIVGARGCGVLDGTDDEMDDAVALARRADVAVIVVGDRLPYGDHAGVNGVPGTVGEGLDAASLDLPGRQEELIRRVHATGTPVVVVLINGRPMSIAWTAQHVPAIVEAWLPGHHGGQAIAEVLLGDTEPSGRLPITVPRHVGQLPVFYNHETAKDFRSEIAHRYADMPWTPLWWFGHGLAYTTFTHAPAVVEAGERVRVTVTVTNTGHRRGAEVVQVYVRDLIASSAPLSRQLAGFRKVWLEPHESRAVSVDLDMRAFRTLQDDLTWQIEDGSFHILVGASSDAITSSVHVVATTDGDVVSFATAPGDGETRANVADSWPYPGP